MVDELVQGLACEEGHIAVGDEDGALEVLGKHLQRALGGAAGALDLVLVGDDRARVDLGHVLGHQVALVADDDGEVLGSGSRGPRRSRGRRGCPAMRCRTLGVADFIRVPSPAARTMTAASRGCRGGCSRARAPGLLGATGRRHATGRSVGGHARAFAPTRSVSRQPHQPHDVTRCRPSDPRPGGRYLWCHLDLGARTSIAHPLSRLGRGPFLRPAPPRRAGPPQARRIAASSSSRAPREWPETSTSTWGSAAAMPPASGWYPPRGPGG